MSRSTPHPAVPKSIRHKQILDVAKENPNASVEAIAAEIPTVTVDLVEDVLTEYSDSVNNQIESPSEGSDEDSANEDSYPEAAELSETQRETLRAIAENPEATQRDLADILDVSAATVSVRVNQIDGFDWEKRSEFATNVLGSDVCATEKSTVDVTTGTADVRSLVDDLADVVSTLEDRENEQRARESSLRDLDPHLLHKVIHACMQSQSVNEDEELQILETLL